MLRDSWQAPPGVLELTDLQVDIWRIRLQQPGSSLRRMESLLSWEETVRAGRIRFQADRDRFILTHGVLREILAKYLRCEPEILFFSSNGHNKPHLPSHRLEFNLTHSGNFALVGVSGGRRIGVDLEAIRSDLEYESIANRYFSKVEFSELMTLNPGQRAEGFFDCWTRKEAYIKAHGLGLSLPLDSFDVSLRPEEPAILRATRPDPIEATRWGVYSVKVDRGYSAATAVERAKPETAASKGASSLELRLWNWEW